MFTESLKGKSVVVTGSSKGIGKGIAECFLKAGCKVLVVSRSQSEASQCAAELGGRHGAGNVHGMAGDVTKYASMEAVCKTAGERFGGIDVLCANAGMFPSARLEEMTEAQWDLVMDTNLKGTFFSVKAALPYLKKSAQGRVILTSSITGPITGFPGWTHYGASKAGQLGFMRNACLELSKYGITVNSILPGNILTEGLQGMGQDYLKGMSAAVPLGRLGTLEEVGAAAVFLASREAAYITGQTIVVDGGQVVPESPDALIQAAL